METFNELDPPARLLLGPGPSPVHPRVTRALSAPALGHLDPALLQLLSESRRLLQGVFRTANPRTLAVSGTGMAGMEAVLGSLLEPADRLLVCTAVPVRLLLHGPSVLGPPRRDRRPVAPGVVVQPARWARAAHRSNRRQRGRALLPTG